MTSVPSIATWYYLPEAATASAGIPKPPDTQADDVIVIALYHWENTTVDHPRGFTRKTKTGTRRALLSVYWYRIPADGTIPDLLFTVTDDLSPGSTHPVTGFLYAIRGADTNGDPFDAVCDLPIHNYVDTTTPAVELTTTTANTLLLYVSTHSTAATVTAPDGFHLFTNTAAPVSLAAGVKNNPTAGPTGPITAEWTTANAVTAWLGAIRPEGAPAVPPPTQPTTEQLTLRDLAADITTAKADAHTLAAQTDTTTQQWIKLAWERLDSALWCVQQADDHLNNLLPDARGAILHDDTGNPIPTAGP